MNRPTASVRLSLALGVTAALVLLSSATPDVTPATHAHVAGMHVARVVRRAGHRDIRRVGTPAAQRLR